jgi:hypothetical protein
MALSVASAAKNLGVWFGCAIDRVGEGPPRDSQGRTSPFFWHRDDDRNASHVGAGSAGKRKSAIRCKMPANMARGIATSAIWNVT